MQDLKWTIVPFCLLHLMCGGYAREQANPPCVYFKNYVIVKFVLFAFPRARSEKKIKQQLDDGRLYRVVRMADTSSQKTNGADIHLTGQNVIKSIRTKVFSWRKTRAVTKLTFITCTTTNEKKNANFNGPQPPMVLIAALKIDCDARNVSKAWTRRGTHFPERSSRLFWRCLCLFRFFFFYCLWF